MSFVHFERLLQKYFDHSDHFTVVPKIVLLDVDVHALNSLLMRDRPGKEFIIITKNLIAWPLTIFKYRLPWIGHVSADTRRNKIIGSSFGLLYRDVAFLPREIYMGKALNGEFKDSSTICIEIKAKQGYVMDDDDETSLVKKCRFCYFQASTHITSFS